MSDNLDDAVIDAGVVASPLPVVPEEPSVTEHPVEAIKAEVAEIKETVTEILGIVRPDDESAVVDGEADVDPDDVVVDAPGGTDDDGLDSTPVKVPWHRRKLW